MLGAHKNFTSQKGEIRATLADVTSSNLLRLAAALALVALLALAALAGSAGAVARKPTYGKPGSVQLVDVEGARGADAAHGPTITFPVHTFRRSPASRDPQKICTTFKILIPATAPATGWVPKTSSKPYCATFKLRSYGSIGNWIFTGEYGVNYHAQFVVTWATKKKKKLAGATYDFNVVDDYKCTTLNCLVLPDLANVPYLTFFAPKT